jgi:hypothetical protein
MNIKTNYLLQKKLFGAKIMRIGLIDVDGHRYPNLALMKLSAWHKMRGDSVEWCVPLDHYDVVYQSKVFDETYSPDIDWVPNADMVIKGGTGYDKSVVLPYEVEHTYPDYGLYPQFTKDTAYGYLTRGCPRACGFCIVSEKEGRKSVKVADLSEFWKGQRNIELLDPSLLACREHMDLLCQLRDSGAHVDFNQGLDIRLLHEDAIDVINDIKLKSIHFAWDNPRDDLAREFERYATRAKHKVHGEYGTVYVLTNYNSTLDQDLYRIYTLHDLGYAPYVMIYDKPNAPKEIRDLQRWCNSKWIFKSCPNFKDYKKGARESESAGNVCGVTY